MTKLTRLVALACALAALTAGPASAANWQSGNVGGYVLTATTAVNIDINAGAATVACTGMVLTGNARSSRPPTAAARR